MHHIQIHFRLRPRLHRGTIFGGLHTESHGDSCHSWYIFLFIVLLFRFFFLLGYITIIYYNYITYITIFLLIVRLVQEGKLAQMWKTHAFLLSKSFTPVTAVSAGAWSSLEIWAQGESPAVQSLVDLGCWSLAKKFSSHDTSYFFMRGKQQYNK